MRAEVDHLIAAAQNMLPCWNVAELRSVSAATGSTSYTGSNSSPLGSRFPVAMELHRRLAWKFVKYVAAPFASTHATEADRFSSVCKRLYSTVLYQLQPRCVCVNLVPLVLLRLMLDVCL